MLTKNAAIDRLQYITKMYIEKQPWVVLDTLSVIFPTIGIDESWREVEDAYYEAHGKGRRDLLDLYSGGSLVTGLPRPSFQWLGISNLGYVRLVEHDYWPVGPAGHRHLLRLLLETIALPTFAGGAMREPHEADGIFPWVARELSKLSKHTITAVEKAIEENLAPLDEYRDYEEALGRLRRSGNAIAQWAKLNRIDLMKKSLAEVLEAIKTFRYSKKVRQGKVVYRFPTGWTVQELRGRRELEPEGKALSHCVGTYCEAVEHGDSVIYSLRDPDGVPYVTMEWEPSNENRWGGSFLQIFGQANSNIGDAQFDQYVLDVGRENDPPLQEQDVQDVVEAIRSMVVEFIDKEKDGEPNGILLAGASLAGRDLSGVDFSGTNLMRMDLQNVDMTEALLMGAELGNAILRGSNLVNADMTGARLQGADLSGAKLLGTILRDAGYDERTKWPDDFDPEAAGAVDRSTW